MRLLENIKLKTGAVDLLLFQTSPNERNIIAKSTSITTKLQTGLLLISKEIFSKEDWIEPESISSL